MITQEAQLANASQQKTVTEFNLTELYYKWFDVVRCDTPDLIKRSQKLRYQVYCIETGFESSRNNPNGLEKDPSDEHAFHSLLLHRPSSIVAGTVRLIIPNRERNCSGLPSLEVSEALRTMPASILPPETTAEISRFSVSKDFRKRLGDGLYPSNIKKNSPEFLGRRALPSITLGLMRAIVEMTRDAGMTHVTAVVEPALIRLLQRLGIRFERTGERVTYHGTRYPVYRNMSDLLEEIYEHRPEIWHAITDSGRIWPRANLEKRVLSA